LDASTRVGVSVAESPPFSRGVLGYWWRGVSALLRVLVLHGAAWSFWCGFWVSAADTFRLGSKYFGGAAGGGRNVTTAAQQGAAPDRHSARNSQQIVTLHRAVAAGELGVVWLRLLPGNRSEKYA
jgi:hypothetical protein